MATGYQTIGITIDDYTPLAAKEIGMLADGTPCFYRGGSVRNLPDESDCVMLGGLAGGQTVKGGTASGDDLTLESTAHATKGRIHILDELLIGTIADLGLTQQAVVQRDVSGNVIANIMRMVTNTDTTPGAGLGARLIWTGEYDTGEAMATMFYLQVEKTGGAGDVGSSASIWTRPSGGSLAQNFILDGSANFRLGTTHGAGFGTNSSRVLGIELGQVPGSSPANMIQLYAVDVDQPGPAGDMAELEVRDEAGNVTVLSPHAATLIDTLTAFFQSHEFPWTYRSVNEYIGKEVNADLYGLCKTVEELYQTVTGQSRKLLWVRDLVADPKPRDPAVRNWDADQKAMYDAHQVAVDWWSALTPTEQTLYLAEEDFTVPAQVQKKRPPAWQERLHKIPVNADNY